MIKRGQVLTFNKYVKCQDLTPFFKALDLGIEDRIKSLMNEGVERGVYPGAVLLVGHKGENIFFQEVGHRSLAPGSDPMQKGTIFDLASLTKPLATSLAIMSMVDKEVVHLDQPLTDLLPETVPEDKRNLTLRLLLCHSAGFPDWKPFYLELNQFPLEERKKQLRQRLLKIPLTYRPGNEVLYSDLGFMMLEWIVEESTGLPLNKFVDKYFYGPLSLKRTFFSNTECQLRFEEDQFAATEDCPWRKRIMRGYVHDENAYVLGGYSSHAGLFGTAEEVYLLADLLRRHFLGQRADYLKPETVKTFFNRQNIVNGSTWALGWDTPSTQDSSSGRYFSTNSVGHLGFTGTSVWMDLEKDIIVVSLTNRIHPTRNNEKIKAFRPKIHDVIMEELGVAST